MTGATISCSVLLGVHERERLRDRSPQIAAQWNFAADRATVIDPAVFGRYCCKCASCDADRNGSDHFNGE